MLVLSSLKKNTDNIEYDYRTYTMASDPRLMVSPTTSLTVTYRNRCSAILLNLLTGSVFVDTRDTLLVPRTAYAFLDSLLAKGLMELREGTPKGTAQRGFYVATGKLRNVHTEYEKEGKSK